MVLLDNPPSTRGVSPERVNSRTPPVMECPRGNPSFNLPDEVILQIISSYVHFAHVFRGDTPEVKDLDERSIARLQQVSRTLRDLCLDDELWKWRCFYNSRFLNALRVYRTARLTWLRDKAEKEVVASRARPGGNAAVAADPSGGPGRPVSAVRTLQEYLAPGRHQFMANWDPTYPSEPVSWCDEYIQRYGPVRINWLEEPHGTGGVLNEVRGVGLFHPFKSAHESSADELLAVAPLDDGTVCLWDVKGTRGKKGSIVGTSKPAILEMYASDRARSKRVISSTTECVSVDSAANRAFFAVQGHLVEIDLTRLDVVSEQSFEWSITALSATHSGIPLTVGTSLGLHLFDYRAKQNRRHNEGERVDIASRVFNDDPIPLYAPLAQPTPLAIAHLPRAGSYDQISDDIYVAGRFTSILHYDRRRFPSIVGTMYSGANLSSLASFPYPLSTLNALDRRHGEIPADVIAADKTSAVGRTLVAGGLYKTKGSLELHSVDKRTPPVLPEYAPGWHTPRLESEPFVANRQTSAPSTITSVITHGTRIVLSDGSGNLRWFERDGFSEVRNTGIGLSDADPITGYSSLFPHSYTSSGTYGMPGDMVCKLLSTQTTQSRDRLNNDDILFWTGERLGLVTFSSGPAFNARDFSRTGSGADGELTEEAIEKLKREREHDQNMREALKRHAQDVMSVSYLGGP